MGADGGTIPKRCELVKNKKKKEKADKNAKKASRWRMCHLSQQPLRKPIIACRLGGLYNKEAVLNAILLKTIRNNVNTKHIRGLKDIKEVKLTDNKEFKETGADKGDTYKDHNVAPYCCPVTGLVMNGNHSFTVNWRCGCVVSEKAIDEVKSTVCHGCGGEFNKDDLVVLNPSDELRRQYEDKLELERELKKAKKNNIKDISDETIAHKTTNGGGHHSDAATKRKAEKRKLEPTSIQDDEKASSAYKSLFTTSEAALKQPKAHWVTHNPLFY